MKRRSRFARSKGETKVTKFGPGPKTLRKRSRERVHLYRPVTLTQISETLDIQPWFLCERLADLEISLSPSEEIADQAIKNLGKLMKVKFRITYDPRGGVIDHGKLGPIIPVTLKDEKGWA